MSEKTPNYEAYVERSHLQSGGEREAWAQVRHEAIKGIEREREAAKASRAARALRKPNFRGRCPTKALIRAANLGDVAGCLQWIEQGANPNGRDGYGQTPLALCLKAGASMESVSIALLEAGGRLAPPICLSAYVDFALAADAGPLSGQVADQANELTTVECLIKASSWGVARTALSACGKLGPVEAVRVLGQAWRLDLACAFHAEGARLAGPFWGGVASHWEKGDADKSKDFDLSSAQGFESMMDLLALGKESHVMPQSVCESLFFHAARRGNARLLCALLDGGLRPNIHWTVKMEVVDSRDHGHQLKTYKRGSLLLACAAGASREAFDLACACPAIVQSALVLNDAPQMLAAAPPARLGDLAALGMNLAASDPEGCGLAHWWALNGRLDGWVTLARVAPEAYELRDRRGQRGVDLVLDDMENPDERAAFQSMLARKEGREIAKVSQRTPKQTRSISRL